MANIGIFRYPGSKAKLLPIIGTYLYPLVESRKFFWDAFVGGGSVLLDIATKYPNKQLFANDKDTGIADFWSIVSDTNRDRLERLKYKLNIKPTIGMYYAHRRQGAEDSVERAFRAIFFNRTSFSGDMRKGASPIGGRFQKSKWTVDCRYNADKLISKTEKISELLRGRLFVESRDISDTEIIERNEVACYLDPPYYVAGKGLYEQGMSIADHKQLSEKLKNRNNWILSYDNAPEITDLYNWANIVSIPVKYCIKGKKTSWNETKEILIIPQRLDENRVHQKT